MSHTKQEETESRQSEVDSPLVRARARATRAIDNMLLDQCEETAKKKTEVAIRTTTPWPFPFSLLQMGNPEADRKQMLADIEKDRKACVKHASATPKD